MEDVGVDAGGVHDAAGGEVACRRGDLPGAVDALEARDLGVEAELDAVLIGVLGKRPVELERVHDGCRGSPERGDHIIGQIGLELAQAVARDDLEALDAIRDTAVEQRLKCGEALLVRADDERADVLEVDAQILAERPHERSAAHVELRHERARLRVESCMDDGRVGLRRAAADILLTLDDADREPPLGELPCGGGTGDTGADDHYVIHIEPPPTTCLNGSVSALP